MEVIETEVLVVGTGPCGITAALDLVMLGVGTIGISRYSGPAHTPRGHITNMRTMEIFRDLDVQDEVQAVGYPLSYLRNNVTGVSFAGLELYRYLSFGTRDDLVSAYQAAGASPPYNIQQHVLEPVLLAAARERGADVRFSTELVGLEQDADAVTARVRERESGEEYQIRAQYLMGADGARSTVAELAGFEFRGAANVQDMVNVWVRADLTRYTEHRPGVLYTMVPPGAGYSTHWSCVHTWDQWLFSTTGGSKVTEEQLIERIHTAIGDPSVEVEILSIAPWQVAYLCATQFRRGRVFLGGDAAHRHPPNRGLGTNTSVQDSFNLAWKLALVLRGIAGEGLLDSYDDERQPVGQWVVEKTLIPNQQTLGGPREESVNPPHPAEFFSHPSTEDEAWEHLRHLLFSPDADAASLRAELAATVRAQDYRSNGLGAELGMPFRYQSSAVVDDGTPWPEPAGDPELVYEPSTHPGKRLPHTWVEHDGELVSTFDAVGHGRFTLITGIGGEAWRDAAATVGDELGLEVVVRMIGVRCEYDDVYGDWARLREVDDTGALLVRPDHHVAWRQRDLPDSPTDALRAALRQILSR